MSKGPTVICIMGTTCAGKDALIDHALANYEPIVGAVQVGKQLRERHAAARFRGLAAMSDTEDEVKEIFQAQYAAALRTHKTMILISGQPRAPFQVDWVLSYAPSCAAWIYADEDTLLSRLQTRFPHDPPGMDLGIKRLANDRIQLYDTLFEVMLRGVPVLQLDSRNHTPQELFNVLMRHHLTRIQEPLP